MTGTTDPTDLPDDETFVAEFKHWRDVRGLSQSRLADKMGYTRSYISKIETGREPPNADIARAADEALQTGGALRRAFLEFERRRDRPARTRPLAAFPAEPADVHALAVVIEHDEAHLSYDGSTFTAFQRRLLRNIGNGPITRYLVRISVDRHPGSPERSNRLYRSDPLTWDELQLEAWLDDGEPLTWSVHHDRDAFKEVWLLFENERDRFPLYPGQTTWLHHRYRVSDRKWGNWYQRAVRMPTQHLEVRLSFPLELDPLVWGLETSTAAQPLPFRTPIAEHEAGDLRTYSWSIDDPPLHARYRLEGRFRARPEGADVDDATDQRKPSEIMASLGIVQADDPDLLQPATPFDLPAEAEDARRVVAQLQAVAERVTQVHNFVKGIGLAAPQIDINRSAAIACPPDGDPIVLLNPRIVDESADITELYEGCLSFFDVRGIVPRSRVIEVEHQDLDGRRRITSYEGPVARIVAHEVDHLHGIVYTDRMRPGQEPIPVEEYRGVGQPWPNR
jgi:peptide deformylase